MFVTTANAAHNIPRPLMERMETLYIPGYTELEKLEIANRYLLPKQKREHGLNEEQLVIGEDTLLRVIREYTRESGVRNLEQQMASLCRKAAKSVVSGGEGPIQITPDNLKDYLGIAKFRYGVAELEDQIGTVTGLAWTEVGGETLMIEVTVVPGSGKLILTGKLGDVMKESAQAAFSYTRSKAVDLGIELDFYEKNDIHIHIPEGAIPKDGPSAGITIATALISALTNRHVSKDVAMTGEITLRGRVLPIGGLKEKSLAAHRAGYKNSASQR